MRLTAVGYPCLISHEVREFASAAKMRKTSFMVDTSKNQAEPSEKDLSFLNGGCRCGAVRYAISSNVLPPVYCCHCLACQSGSGSAFSEQAVVSDAAITSTGTILDYRFVRLDGELGHHRICAKCYTRLWSTNSAFPTIALVRAGTLDRSPELIPKAHMWTKRKQPWIEICSDMPQWRESPPDGELAIALATQTSLRNSI